jgi:hypothetical protein
MLRDAAVRREGDSRCAATTHLPPKVAEIEEVPFLDFFY